MALPLKYNIRNIVVRKGSTLATAFTIGLTVAVFLMVMALARGIDLTLSSSGEPLNVIVLREGSTAELNSSVTREQFNDLIYLDGVTREDDKPLATAEIVTLIYKARKGMTQGSNVTVRGVGPMSFKLRSGYKTIAGREFQPGLPEAVVSKRIAERFQGLTSATSFAFKPPTTRLLVCLTPRARRLSRKSGLTLTHSPAPPSVKLTPRRCCARKTRVR